MKYVKYCFVTYFPHSTFLNIPSDLPLIFFICLFWLIAFSKMKIVLFCCLQKYREISVTHGPYL